LLLKTIDARFQVVLIAYESYGVRRKLMSGIESPLILRENHPTIVSYEPDEDDPDRLLNMDLRSALADFDRDRQALVGRLRSLQVNDWLRPATHTGHARYSVFLMCRHIALHDGLHAYRIEESALGSHWPTER